MSLGCSPDMTLPHALQRFEHLAHTEYLTYLFALHTEGGPRGRWTTQRLQKLQCSTTTSALAAHPHLQRKQGTASILLPGLVYWDVTSQETELFLILTYWSDSDVYSGLNHVSALQAGEGAGVRPGVFLAVWLVQQKRSVPQQKQVLVQVSLALPLVHGVSGSAVISQDEGGLGEHGEGPGEGEIVESVWSHARDGQYMTLLLCHVLWKRVHTHIHIAFCPKLSSLWKHYNSKILLHLGFSETQSTPGSCPPMWTCRSRCGWSDYPESSGCSPLWTGPCGQWF